MGELKPIGSEKLNGDAKLKRILELTYYKQTEDDKKSSEVIKESTTGVYGIVKEKDGYYVKRGLNENSLDYIGGLYMKNKNRFNSYGEAFKKLEFLVEQEKLQEATKYVLKQPSKAPQAEAPMPMPTNEPPSPPAAPDPTAMDTGDEGALPPPPGGEEGGDENAPEGDVNDPVKVIQTKTGRLTQKLNQYKDDLESEDIKYVLGMVLSAVDLDKMEEKDKDEILNKLEGDEEEGEEGGEEGVESPVPSPEDEAGGIGSGETGGIDPINSLEELINNPFEDDSFVPYDESDDEDEIYDLGPEDYKASKAAQYDIEKEREGMDDEPDDYESIVGPDEDQRREDDIQDYFDGLNNEEPDFNQEFSKGDKEIDEFMSGESVDPTGEEVKELDIDELTNMVNGSVKETLGKYFSE